MTTRKRLTATVLSNSLLLFTINAQATGTDQQPAATFLEASITVISQTGPLKIATDTGLLYKPADSMVAFYKKEWLKAPEIKMNPAAVPFVKDYIRKNTEALQKVEQRSVSVFKIMEPILSKYALPLELKYLAVVESDLIRTAVSRVGAAGPWQLMPGTARELGLKVSKKADERKQYYKSTTAAAKYLRDLYKEYGDWLLVIAAYNAGPGVINKAIRKSGSRNFWKLQHFLPAETRGHVKRFIGTHYYFEDAGSETTLTKAENMAYAKALAGYTALQQNAAVLNTTIPLESNVNSKEVLKEPAAEPVFNTLEK